MSKVAKQLYDWEPPAAAKDEGEIVQRIVSEIARNVPGYTEPVPISEDVRLADSAKHREKEREAEHQERIEALEAAEKQLKDDHKRLAKLAQEKEAERRQIKQKQRDEEVQRRERQQQAAAERRRLAALEHEWGNFKIHAAQAQFNQQRQAYFDDLQRTVDDFGRMVSPAPEPQIVYIEKDDEPPAGGALPRLPTWR